MGNLGATEYRDAGTGAPVGCDVHQRRDCKCGGQPERLACCETGGTAASAVATAAYVGAGHDRRSIEKGVLMDFSLTEEQQLIVKTTREFVENELYPYEQQVESTGRLDPSLRKELRTRAIAAGLYAANMPTEVGGAGLDTVSW